MPRGTRINLSIANLRYDNPLRLHLPSQPADVRMKTRVIDKTMFREMPWANGGGVTTELFVHKDERSGRILWRISMAGVDADGPFSHFAGYDRVLVLLQGQGLRLSHQDGTEDYLRSAYELACFAGDIGTCATLTHGPVQDFNVITDRSTFKSAVTVVRAGINNRLPINASVLAVFAVDMDLVIADPAMGRHCAPRGDLLLVDTPQQGDWTVSGATAIVIQLFQPGEY
jgi:environmental stress-induced protein Ves